MSGTVRLKGLDKVVGRLKKDVPKEVERLSEAGLIKASIIVRRDMEKTSPKTPIDTSNLRASWFVVTRQESKSNPEFKGEDASKMSSDHSAAISEMQGKAMSSMKPILLMGFSARYAAAVHEGLTKSGGAMDFSSPRMRKGKMVKRRPGAGAKFFESAIERNRKAMAEAINGELKKI